MAGSSNEHVRRLFDGFAGRYDAQMTRWERRIFAGSREWVVRQARGQVVEIAVGTGLNVPLYAEDSSVLGIDLSEGMLECARRRVAEEGLDGRIELRQGDVQALEVPDAWADTVVSTFTLCTIPDPAAALREAYRVLRPTGQVLLAEHGPSSVALLRWGMRLAEPFTVKYGADHLTRDPRPLLEEAGFQIQEVERASAGVSFRVRAIKPADGPR